MVNEKDKFSPLKSKFLQFLSLRASFASIAIHKFKRYFIVDCHAIFAKTARNDGGLCHFKHSEVSARIYSKLVLCVAILVVKACKC